MHIPESLRHFPEPALIVLADHVHARLMLAFEDSFEEVESFEMPDELKSDNEGGFYNPDTSGVNAPEPRLDEERLRKYVRVLAERINQLVRDEHTATALHLIIPADMSAMLKKELAPEAANLIGKEIHANVMKEDEAQILERVVTA
ncbi:MAG: host attachment family protein [Candidatus Uhrbacteria bacterium]|nr:host attachment family protein [Candidatus Uhrbacteria bacterium]